MVIAPNELLDCDDMHNAQLAEVLLPYKKRIAELESALHELLYGNPMAYPEIWDRATYLLKADRPKEAK